MPTYFILTLLESGWTWQDFQMDGMEFDYCTTVLDIPEEAIDYIEVFDRSLEIQLFDDSDFASEDWYTQLLTLAKVSEATVSE
jgi:hypothetical protein